MKSPSRLRTVVVMLVTCTSATLMPACGEATDESASPAAAGPGTAGRSEESTGNNGQRSNRGHSSRSSANPSNKARRARSNEAAKAQSNKVSAGNKMAQERSTGKHVRSGSPRNVAGCPAAMSKQQCVEAGESYEQATEGGSHTVQGDECPRAMSQKACREAGEALQQAGEGHVAKANECPSAMTDQQCAEAGRAYQEAAK